MAGIDWRENGYPTILDALEKERVIKVSREDGGRKVDVREACDDFFNIDLSKQELGQLIKELTCLHDEMED